MIEYLPLQYNSFYNRSSIVVSHHLQMNPKYEYEYYFTDKKFIQVSTLCIKNTICSFQLVFTYPVISILRIISSKLGFSHFINYFQN